MYRQFIRLSGFSNHARLYKLHQALAGLFNQLLTNCSRLPGATCGGAWRLARRNEPGRRAFQRLILKTG